MKKSFRELTPAEFHKFTKSCPTKSYMQSLPMFQRYQEIGRESYLLGVLEGDKVVAAGLASVIYQRYGRKIFTFSRGPLADFSAHSAAFAYFLEQTKQFLKSKNGIILQISPTLLTPDTPSNLKTTLKNLNFKYLGEYEQVKWTYALDFSKIENLPKIKLKTKKSPVLNPGLTPEQEQALLRHFRRDHRYSIRYATERYNLKIRELPPSEYHILRQMMAEAGRVHGFVPRDQQFFEQIAAAFQDDAVALVVELPDGTPIAAAFFLLYGDEVIYLSSGFSREHKKLGGPHLIQWTMIKYAYANGYRQYNFWGTNPSPENGVFKFKQGFHGEVQEFVGTYAAPLSPLGWLYLKKIHPAEHRDIG